MRERLERYFEFAELGTTWRTEIVAGITTFFTMAYIIFVNPSILRDAGMPFQGVLAATCACAAFGSILMGAFARYPIALAPGMGLNAYFAYSVVLGMKVSWQTALGAVFLSGLLFLGLTLTGAPRKIVATMPKEMYAAVAAGIGLFIAMLGLKNAGLIVASPATLVQLGDLRQPGALLALFGLLITAILQVRGVRAAMILGVLATTVVGGFTGLVQWQPQTYGISDLSSTLGQLDFGAAAKLGFLEVVFVFLFVDVFDNVGTLLGVTAKAGFMDGDGNIPRLRRILITDSVSTLVGAFAGTSPVVSYIESAAGVVAGGRSGVAAIVTGVLFILALFIAPVVGAVPAAATAPALIVVGSLMMAHVGDIPWSKTSISIPAFLAMVTIPLTASIATGLSLGFTAYALLRIFSEGVRKQDWLIYVLAALFIARFAYLSGS